MITSLASPSVFNPGQVNPCRDFFFIVARVNDHQPDPDFLHKDELAKAARFRREEDRSAYLVRHTLINRIVGHYLNQSIPEWEFRKTITGKPLLPEQPFHISISRSGNMLAFALGPREIGIDIELLRNASGFEALVETHYTAEEKLWLDEKNDAETFFRIWTRKEAVLKATGIGLDTAIDQINTVPDQIEMYGNKYLFCTMKHENSVLSMALRQADDDPVTIQSFSL